MVDRGGLSVLEFDTLAGKFQLRMYSLEEQGKLRPLSGSNARQRITARFTAPEGQLRRLASDDGELPDRMPSELPLECGLRSQREVQ
jgi:hypothetical protein